MKALRNVSRIIVGIVFVFSGFVKGIDPLGSTYKFLDYFEAFGMPFMEPLAFPLAILLSALEFGLGICLLVKVRMQISAWITLIFMAFFTVLTFILAIYNPVSDCGCFGDAIIMTNWETFWKNVVLSIFVLVVFFERKKYYIDYSNLQQWAVAVAGFFFMVVVSIYCYMHLPLMDFRPYAEGAYLPEKMEIPEGAPQPEYKTILKYQKNGEIKEFDLENLPDSTWEWVDTENILIKEGYQPEITDFAVSTKEGDDITDILLADHKFTFIVVSYDINRVKDKFHESLQELNDYAKSSPNAEAILLTSSLDDDIQKFLREAGLDMPYYIGDEIVLKTIVRANPGIVLMKSGTIMKKWHIRDLPPFTELDEEYIENPVYEARGSGKLKISV